MRTATREDHSQRGIGDEPSLESPNEDDMQQLIATTATRNHRLTRFWSAVVIVLTVVGILLSMNQVFFWNLGGLAILTNAYLYLLLACFLPIVFIVWPLRKR